MLATAVLASGAPDPAPARKFTVVTFGDSTTAVRQNVDVYTAQLERRFPAAQFLNRGVGGNNTEHARQRFERDVLAAKPDLVIIQFGQNDSVIDVWKKPPAEKPRVAVADYERNLRGFVTTLQGAGSAVILMTPNQRRWSPILLERYSRPPYNPADERSLLFLMKDYVEAVRRVAHDLRVPLVDVYAFYDEWERTTGRSCSALMLDGQHPNTAGHQLEADALEPIIRQILAAFESARALRPPTEATARH